MIKKFSLLLTLIILLTGCASTYYVNEDPGNYIKNINYLGSKYSSVIELNDGSLLHADSISIKNDTLYARGNELQSISIKSIATIKLRDVTRGFFDGLWTGLGIGFGSMAAIGLASKNSSEGLGYAPLLIGGALTGTSIIINTLFSGKKNFVFKKNLDNSFTLIE